MRFAISRLNPDQNAQEKASFKDYLINLTFFLIAPAAVGVFWYLGHKSEQSE